MNEEKVTAKIYALIRASKKNMNADEIKTKTFRELGFSSMELVQLLVDVEETFDIEIKQKIETVDQLIQITVNEGGN